MHQGTLPIHVTSSDTAQLKSLIRQMSGILKWKHFSVNIADQAHNEYFFSFSLNVEILRSPADFRAVIGHVKIHFSIMQNSCYTLRVNHINLIVFVIANISTYYQIFQKSNRNTYVSRGFLFKKISCIKYNGISSRVTIILA